MSLIWTPDEKKEIVNADGDKLDLFIDPSRLQAVEQSKMPCNGCSTVVHVKDSDSAIASIKAGASTLSEKRIWSLIEDGKVLLMRGTGDNKVTKLLTLEDKVESGDVLRLINTAKWAFYATNPLANQPEGSAAFVCSHCFLYNSAWGKRRKELLARMVARTEKAITANQQKQDASLPAYEFPKDEAGLLTDNIDLDKVLGSLLFLSVYQLQKYEQLMQDQSVRESVFGTEPQFKIGTEPL